MNKDTDPAEFSSETLFYALLHKFYYLTGEQKAMFPHMLAGYALGLDDSQRILRVLNDACSQLINSSIVLDS